MSNKIDFVDVSVAREKIENGIYLTTWLTDNLEHREILKRFYINVMRNNGRQAYYVKRGGLISLYVNRVA